MKYPRKSWMWKLIIIINTGDLMETGDYWRQINGFCWDKQTKLATVQSASAKLQPHETTQGQCQWWLKWRHHLGLRMGNDIWDENWSIVGCNSIICHGVCGEAEPWTSAGGGGGGGGGPLEVEVRPVDLLATGWPATATGPILPPWPS